MLEKRASIIRQVRTFFNDKKYLELDTPLLSEDLIPESCLEVFETKRLFPSGSKEKPRSMYLIPSPEIWMKKIIANHKVNIFQICKSFRNGESQGRLHNSEFTMLEYYTMNAGYLESLELTEKLFDFLADKAEVKSLRPPFLRITVEEAFKTWAGFDLFSAAQTPGALEDECRRLGIEPPKNASLCTLYDLIFIHTVEPNLNKEKPLVLIDYPAFVSCLAKKSQDGRTYERWELYCGGIELANCFSEETNPQRVKEFFTSEAAEKQKNAIVKHNIDFNYWKMFDNFPRCSGAAMGLDRLIMALCGKKSIDGVLPF